MKLIRKDHKGENGRVLIVGGSQDYVGAPALTALAALRTGVDIVTVAAPEKVAWAINNYSPDIITKKLPGDELHISHAKEIIDLAEKHDVVIIGPGMGLKKELVYKLIREIRKPFVIDADAIKVISLDAATNAILTPNMHEFEMLCANTEKRLVGEKFEIEPAIKGMQKYIGDNVILLKGPTDTIFAKHLRHINKTGHNSMTIGGTGDILAGICGGYLALTGKQFESAVQAAQVTGKAGEFMYKHFGYGYSPLEMAKELWRFTRSGTIR